MTSHKKRVQALMRFHGMNEAEAERRARNIERGKTPRKRVTKKAAKKAAPKKTRARKNPVKRAAPKVTKKRVAKKNPIKRGITARARKSSRKPTFGVESSRTGKSPWKGEGIFPTEAKAKDYAFALNRAHPRLWFRVVLK